MAFDDFLEKVGLERPVPLAVPAGLTPFAPAHAADPDNVQSFTVKSGTDLDVPLAFEAGSVVVDNSTSAYMNVVDATTDGGGRFLSPGAGGNMKILGRRNRARITWQAPPTKTQPLFVPGEQAIVTFYAAAAPPDLGIAVPSSAQVQIRTLGGLSINSLAAGFNDTGGQDFTDIMLMGWQYWATGSGAAPSSFGPALKGLPSNQIVLFSDMHLLTGGQSGEFLMVGFPILIIGGILPATDTAYRIGLQSETGVATLVRGRVYTGF